MSLSLCSTWIEQALAGFQGTEGSACADSVGVGGIGPYQVRSSLDHALCADHILLHSAMLIPTPRSSSNIEKVWWAAIRLHHPKLNVMTYFHGSDLVGAVDQ
jgi:hypothetical protein